MYVSKENPVIQEVRSYETNLDRAYKENKKIKTFHPTTEAAIWVSNTG